MENLDVLVLRTLSEWRSAGRRAILATVARTWGSSPRPVGSIMAIRDDGVVVGSVSGGCIEDDLIDRFARSSAESKWSLLPEFTPDASLCAGRPPLLLRYGITADEAHRFGLPCGGTLELLLEFDPDAASLEESVNRLQRGELVRRTVRMNDGQVTLDDGNSGDEVSVDQYALRNTFGPEYRMLLIGAGQLAEYVATIALFNGFAVTVCDPRVEYRTNWSVPLATLTSDMPDDVVARMKPDGRMCVIALTHDPKLDDLALLEALNSEAFYIGAIGSRRNNLARRERFIQHFEQTEKSLARLRGPIGLYIGSKVPAEIAVSVMAEVIAAKNSVDVPPKMLVGPAKDRHLSSDQEVSELCDVPGILVTTG